MRLRWLPAALIAGTTVLGGGTAAALIAFAPSAGATTQQSMLRVHDGAVSIDVGGLEPCLPYDLVIAGNGHEHMFVNPNGDFWANYTVEGTGTAGPYSGHAEAWFGQESNNGAQVTHFKDDIQLGNGLKIQQTGQFVVNANGFPVVTNVVNTCG